VAKRSKCYGWIGTSDRQGGSQPREIRDSRIGARGDQITTRKTGESKKRRSSRVPRRQLLRKENGRYFFFFFVAFLTAFLTTFLIFFLAAMRNLLRCYYDPDRRARSHPRDLTEDCPSLHEDIQVRLELVQCVAEMFVACGQSPAGQISPHTVEIQ
jgi:hypothetical protein